MSYTVQEVAGPHVLGEGPHWDDERQVLYYVDALASSICRYDPKENKTYVCRVDSGNPCVSIIIPVKGTKDKFLVTIDNQITETTWDGVSATPTNVRVLKKVEETEDKKKNRFNDGKIDPTGRLWIGTMGNMDSKGVFPQKKGSLFSFSKDFTEQKHVEGLTIANGLAWSADLKTMYYIDTPTKIIDAFDYDSDTGLITNRRVLYDFATNPEFPADAGPDGMTIDTEGNLWVACFGAFGVYNINSKTGELIRKIDIPSPQTTSVAFGGVNRDELYVVSAKFNLSAEVENNYPLAGYTFKVTGLGVKGDPMLPIDL